MRIVSPVTDVIKRSLLTTIGDLVTGDPVDHDRLAAGVDGTFLMGTGAGVKPAYEKLDGILGKVLTAQGAGSNPLYKSLFDLLITKGDVFHLHLAL